MFWHTIGFIAAVLTMFGFVPQMVKIIATKSARDISIIALLQFAAGTLLWLIYGTYLKNWIIVFANAVTFITVSITIFCYCRYRKNNL